MSKNKLKLPKDHPYADGRICTECGVFKSASQYSIERDKRALTGVAMRSKCKQCNEAVKYKSFIKRTYDITYEDYEALLISQNYSCAICKSRIGNARSSRLFVDHCHNTAKVRGLLCSNCNHGLGQFKDSPKLLQRAIEYLGQEVTTPVEYE